MKDRRARAQCTSIMENPSGCVSRPERPSLVPLSFRPEPKENFTSMVGAIGTGKHPRPNRRLVGDAPRLPVRTLPKGGRSVTLEWQGVALAPHTRLTRTGDGVVIETGGTEVEVVLREWPMPTVRGRQRGIRTRMICPRCEASRDALHWIDGVWGCRGCLDLAYASRHRQRYCPAIARRARLRRKLVRTPPRSLQARRLREQIRREGRAMLAHLERVNSDLSKRSRRHARHGRSHSE
jgi:hypothetical protein